MRCVSRFVFSLLALNIGATVATATSNPTQIEGSDTIFADSFDLAYFIVPYSADGSALPSPTSRDTALSTQVQKADVAFLVDTTASMSSEVTALKNSFSSFIAPSLESAVPDIAFGVAGHDDVPYGSYGTTAGGCLDLPYDAYEPQGYVTTNAATARIAISALTIHCGGDLPGSQVLAIHHAITGDAITWPTGSVLAEYPPDGTFGALRFRSDSLPIIVNITNFAHHNGGRALDFSASSYMTGENPYSFSTWGANDAVTAMNNVGAKYLSFTTGQRTIDESDAYGYGAFISDMTGSSLSLESFTHGNTCAATACCTGLNGGGLSADGPGGRCRSVFTVGATGTDLSTAIVNGVDAVLKSARFQVTVQAYNDAGETIDVVDDFILKVEPDPIGGSDPITGDVCTSFEPGLLEDNFTGPQAVVPGGDGVDDSISGGTLGSVYCFKVTPKANTTVVATASEQVFHAWLRVIAVKPNGTLALGIDREIGFIVPALGH
jgi:hypothetical protein